MAAAQLQPDFTYVRLMPLFGLSHLWTQPLTFSQHFKLKNFLEVQNFHKIWWRFCVLPSLPDKAVLCGIGGTNLFHFGYTKKCFIPRHCFAHMPPVSILYRLTQSPGVQKSLPVASQWLIVQGQLNWRLSQGKRYPKENSNSWNVSDAPTGCEPYTTPSFFENVYS